VLLVAVWAALAGTSPLPEAPVPVYCAVYRLLSEERSRRPEAEVVEPGRDAVWRPSNRRRTQPTESRFRRFLLGAFLFQRPPPSLFAV